MLDLRTTNDHQTQSEKTGQPWMTQSLSKPNLTPNYVLSLDRKAPTKMQKCASMDNLNDPNKNSYVIKNRTGFYAQPIANYGVPIYYGPLDGPDFLIYKKQIDKLSSKNSLSNTSADDVQKYRDVAL